MCNQLIHEMRPGDHQTLQAGTGRPRSFAACCDYVLRYTDRDLRIAKKRLLLLNRDQPLENISFIL